MNDLSKLVYAIPPEYHHWDGYASPRAGYDGSSIHPGSHLNMGYSVSTKEGVMELPHMHHAVDEYLVFTGANMTDFYGSFDAEVEVWLGDDPLRMEKITITAPSVIRIPPNVWHCPIYFKRVGKPVCFIPLYLDGCWSKIEREPGPDGRDRFVYDGAGIRRCVKDRSRLCSYCGACFSEDAKSAAVTQDDFLAPYRMMEKNPRTGSFDHLVYTMKPEQHPLGDFFVSPRGSYPGILADPEARVSFAWDVVQKPCQMFDVPHMHHCADQYLFFLGYDFMDPFASFDAEIEVKLGYDPNHLQTFLLTRPTVIRIPPNVWHGPFQFRHVGKPVNFMPFYLDGCQSYITRELDDSGHFRYLYRGTGLPE